MTSQLRPYDAGIMELGLEYTNKMAIPPHQEKFLLTGYCIEECTAVVSISPHQEKFLLTGYCTEECTAVVKLLF